MKKLDERNPVYFSAQEAWERYPDHLGGLLSGPLCVVSNDTLPKNAGDALEASANALEYGQHAITYVTIQPQSAHNDETRTPLSGKQLFGIVEAIDPLVIVATDSQSMAALSHAYRSEFSPAAPARLFGRTAVGFVNFPGMLDEPAEKQKAWAHLKRLGHKPKPR